MKDVIAILRVLAFEYTLSEEHQSRVLVPDTNGSLHPSGDVFFPDTYNSSDTEADILNGLRPTHPDISKSLASGLGLQFASSMLLGDEEDDDLDMAENLTTRIDGVLNDYGIEYAVNEFFANAADAGAKSFTAIVDERSFERHTVLSPDIAHLQGPSLVLYNDATFSASDFDGLRQVGQGNKLDDPNSIGRYGLGALSLFHFTEVCSRLLLIRSGTHSALSGGFRHIW